MANEHITFNREEQILHEKSKLGLDTPACSPLESFADAPRQRRAGGRAEEHWGLGQPPRTVTSSRVPIDEYKHVMIACVIIVYYVILYYDPSAVSEPP